MSKKEYTVEGVENKNPNKFGGMVSRAIPIKTAKNIDEGIDTVATTEAPAMVVDWERYQIVREILPMRYMEAPNNDKVPLLDTHSRGSIDKIKGSASGFKADGENLMCKTFISKTEQAVRDKVAEGHIDSVSIGYMTDRDYTVEIPKGASVTVDGNSYKNEFDDGYPMVIRTWWKVHELSLVPIGADDAAKFKSEAHHDNKILLDKVNQLSAEIEELKKSKEPEKERGLTYHEAQVRLLKHI
jgi:hypothetical protein